MYLLREKIVLALLNDFFQLNSSPNMSQKEIAESSQRVNKDGMYTQSCLGHLGIRLTARIDSFIAIPVTIQVILVTIGGV